MTAHSSPDSNSELRTDIEAAKQKMRTKVGSGREIKKLTSYLWDNETVNLMAGGTYGAGTGLVVLTDRRLLFLKDGVLSKTTEDFPMEKISSASLHGISVADRKQPPREGQRSGTRRGLSARVMYGLR